MDWKFYLLYNYDVLNAYGYIETAAIEHYEKYGKNENRIYNLDQLYNHYPLMTHFDIEYYKTNNIDLINFHDFSLLRHYIISGHKELRKVNFTGPLYKCFIGTNLGVNEVNLRVNEATLRVNEAYPRVSIIIPVYNRHELLDDCIMSCINQTYKNIQIIIVDDCSNEITKTIINKYSDTCDIITNTSNMGCYISINNALPFCTGDFITIHGSDDVSLNNRIERMVYEFINNDNLLMVGNYIYRSHKQRFNSVSELTGYNVFNDLVVSNMSLVCHNTECCKPLVALGILMYSRKVFYELGSYENTRKGGDMIFFEAFLKHYENITFDYTDCSHRYLTGNLLGKHYKIIEEILYLSTEMNNSNITNQGIRFDINKYRLND